MVEFALVAPVFFIIALGTLDLGRMTQVNSTIADAARLGARQAAANAVSTDQPFAARDANPCSGTTFTNNASGHGCLGNAGIMETVKARLTQGAITTDPTVYVGDAATCRASFPAAGFAKVCINPTDTIPNSTQPTYSGSSTPCASARQALGRQPNSGDLGTRSDEWSGHLYRDCFLVQVTVLYTYKPATGLLQSVIGNSIQLASSTSTVAEY